MFNPITQWILKTVFNAKKKVNAAVMLQKQVLQQRCPVMSQRLNGQINLWGKEEEYRYEQERMKHK
jgi:hypothetical protein